MPSSEIYQFVRVSDSLITSGQPTAEQLTALAAEGYAMVINLAPHDPTRSLPDEAGLVRSLGMTYAHIPVDWDHPTVADFAAFEQTMQERSDRKALIHCVANYRATAFFSLYAQKHLGWSRAQADAFRAVIWQGSDYPIWRTFIAQLQSDLPVD